MRRMRREIIRFALVRTAYFARSRRMLENLRYARDVDAGSGEGSPGSGSGRAARAFRRQDAQPSDLHLPKRLVPEADICTRYPLRRLLRHWHEHRGQSRIIVAGTAEMV